MGFWDSASWSWNLHWNRAVREFENEGILDLLNLINACKHQRDTTYQWSWGRAGDGLYTVRSTYALLNNEGSIEEASLFKHIWRKWVPSKGNLDVVVPLVLPSDGATQ
ncbi:hypothetical protein Ancab_010974 [Ancistrocladus abbreviatus]